MNIPNAPDTQPLATSTGTWSRRDVLRFAGMGAALSSLPATSFGFDASSNPSVSDRLDKTHDLTSLPAWGPYSKKYFGISHIPDIHRGLRFDLSLFPRLTGSPTVLPTVLSKSGVHPWQAAADLSFYTLRSELIWKDQLYADLSFARLDDTSRLIRLELANYTAKPAELAVAALAQMNYPQLNGAEPIRLAEVVTPPGALWVHALDYEDLTFAKPRPTDNLVYDGRWRAEDRQHDCVQGSVVAQNFGRDAGDTVLYRVHVATGFTNAAMVWRFRARKGESLTFHLQGPITTNLTFTGNGSFSTVSLPLGEVPAGTFDLKLTSLGGGAPAINGFVLAEYDKVDSVQFPSKPWHRAPTLDSTSVPGAVLLEYGDVDNAYGFTLAAPLNNARSLKWSELDAAFGKQDDKAMRDRMEPNAATHYPGDPDSQLSTASTQPLSVAPHTARVLYGLVCTGPKAEVIRALKAFDPKPSANEARFLAAKSKAFVPVGTPAGEPYKLGQQLMSAVTLTDLVYPVYCQRDYIKHYTPGRCWDSLYTWDDGFIGIGLLELDIQPAIDILNAYTTPPGSQSAFILHGTPLEVQVYLFIELWNRTQSRELLAYFYPRLRQFHRFVAGRLGSSTTRQHKDNLICTWDYFYNTGGWDDYPPQKFVHDGKMESSVAPVISSAHVIRCAKLLRMAASALDLKEDFAEYDADVATLSASLQQYSWDNNSGYFGYVVHDKDGNPKGILRDQTGANFNMGLDGVAPLNSGICTSAQEKLLLERIFSTNHLWTPVGITTVDQSASYYSPNGYWNGRVWFAHQWFLWKTMLDLGHADLAIRIAEAGLNIWKTVTDTTYDCVELFNPHNNTGLGWPQFSSLNSPILPWFSSLYTPGRLTCGFEVWRDAFRFDKDNRTLQAKLRTSPQQPGKEFSVLACMASGLRYKASWNGHSAVVKQLHDGALHIQLPYETGVGELRVEPV